MKSYISQSQVSFHPTIYSFERKRSSSTEPAIQVGSWYPVGQPKDQVQYLENILYIQLKYFSGCHILNL